MRTETLALGTDTAIVRIVDDSRDNELITIALVRKSDGKGWELGITRASHDRTLEKTKGLSI